MPEPWLAFGPLPLPREFLADLPQHRLCPVPPELGPAANGLRGDVSHLDGRRLAAAGGISHGLRADKPATEVRRQRPVGLSPLPRL